MFIYLILVLSYLPNDSFLQSIAYSSINITAYLLIIYGNAFYLIPKFYEQKKTATYFFFAVLLFTATSLFRYLTLYYVYNHFFAARPVTLTWPGFTSSLISGFLVYLTSVLFYIALHYFKLQQKQEQLLKQNAEARLSLLTARVQPHFLFNTLNNIYYIAQRESPATAVLIAQLSQIMRYFVDDAPRERIPIRVELEFIRNYINLEKLRMRYPLRVDFETKGVVESHEVPAMLFIPLVENVFKHGIDKRRNDNFIRLSLAMVQGRMELVVENRLVNVTVAKVARGTGIRNLNARLGLLYGKDYSLTCAEKDSIYCASLNIPL